MQLVLAKLDCPACMPAAHTDIPQVRFADRGSQCNAQTVIWLRMDLNVVWFNCGVNLCRAQNFTLSLQGLCKI